MCWGGGGGGGGGRRGAGVHRSNFGVIVVRVCESK